MGSANITQLLQILSASHLGVQAGPESFPLLGIPQSRDGTAGKPAEKSHKDVQCLFQHPGKAEPFKGTLEDFKWVVKMLEVFEEGTEQTLTLLWANTEILLGFGAACLEPGKNDSCNTRHMGFLLIWVSPSHLILDTIIKYRDANRDCAFWLRVDWNGSKVSFACGFHRKLKCSQQK